jgi:type II secretory pathway pseudopilin PulG
VAQRERRRVGCPMVNSRLPLVERGFTYLLLLFMVAIFSISAAIASEYWMTVVKREQEKELLFIGNQYRLAIKRFYESPASGEKSYPRALKDLLQDPRTPAVSRYIRRLYPDPMTGAQEWGVVRDEKGGIQGVFSISTEVPLKQAGFDSMDSEFEKKSQYSAWKFIYLPSTTTPEETENVMPPSAEE